jgi:hypothetical protein
MNGVEFNPSEVEIKDDEKIGESRRMGDGTLRYYHRAFKGQWAIKWNGVKEIHLPAIRAIGRLTTAFTFIDYENVSHSVMVLPGGFSRTLTAERVTPDTKRYDVTITLDEV